MGTYLPPARPLPLAGQAVSRAAGSLAIVPVASLIAAAEQSRGDLRLTLRHPTSGSVVIALFHDGEPRLVFSPGDDRSLADLLIAAGVIDRATLAELVGARDVSRGSLERLISSRTGLTPSDIRPFLDFQARERLLDALAWRDGFFEMLAVAPSGDGGSPLRIPPLASLVLRAEARAAVLPGLLAALPAAPEHTIVRHRRGGGRPSGGLEHRIWTALEQPLLLPQLVARLLVDDDLVIDAVVRLGESRSLALEPRVALVRNGCANDPRLAAVLREVIGRLRNGPRGGDVWSLVVAASPTAAASLVERLSPAGTPGAEGSAGAATGLLRRNLLLDADTTLCLLAVRPEALGGRLLDGLLSRCDALTLVRAGDDPGELERLNQLRSLLERRIRNWRPMVLGVDLAAGFRSWGEEPDAIVGLPGWDRRAPEFLLERILEGLLAASCARTSP